MFFFLMTMTCVMFACCTIGSVARNLIIINTRADMHARTHVRPIFLLEVRFSSSSSAASLSNIERHRSEMIMMTVKAMINFLFYQIWHFAASGSFYYQFHSAMSRDLFCFDFPNTTLHILSCFLISNIHC